MGGKEFVWSSFRCERYNGKCAWRKKTENLEELECVGGRKEKLPSMV